MKEKKYFHQVSQQEVDSIIQQGLSWQYVIDHYKHPDCCNLSNALEGSMGCWSLTDTSPNGMRTKIGVDFCKTCYAFKKDYHEDND